MAKYRDSVKLRDALERLWVLDRSNQGWDFHYTSCGIYEQGLFTVLKHPDDPTRRCTCGRDEAIATVLASSIGMHLAQEWAKQNHFKLVKK